MDNGLSLGLAALVLGIVAMILFTGRQARQEPERNGYKLARVTRFVALACVGLTGLGTLYSIGTTLLGTTAKVSLPVQEFWPTVPGGVQLNGGQLQVVGGGFTQGMVSVDGLDMAARMWLAAHNLLQGAVVIVVGLVVAGLCAGVVKGKLFQPQLIKGIRITAVSVLVGGLGWQLCQMVGGSLAANQILGVAGWQLDSTALDGWTDIHHILGLPSPGTGGDINLWPVGAALVLFVLAAVSRHGARVQKEAEGLRARD